MAPPTHIQRTRRIRIACALLVTAATIDLLRFIFWRTVSALGARTTVVNAIPNFVDEIERWTETLCAVIGVILIFRAQIFVHARQKFALLFLSLLLLLSRASTETIALWVNYQNKTGSPDIESSILFWHLPLWINRIVPHLIAAALIVLVMAPQPKINAWKSTFQLHYRVTAVLVTVALWIPAFRNFIWMMFRQSLINDYSSGTYSMPRHLVEFLRSPIFAYSQHAALLLAVVFLIRIYRSARSLIPGPNHCPTCAYPLDTSMTTCPECGSPRPAQPTSKTTPQPPLPEG